MKKKALNRIAGREKGQALIIVMLLLLVGALIIAPMLSQVGSGLKSGKDVYEERMELFYSADTGVEDALWQVDNETLESKFASQGYDEYDYDEIYEYDDPLDINDNEVDVTIQNIWVPEAYIPAPATPAQARAIIEGNLVITSSSSMSGISTYQIKVIYNYDSVEDPGGADLKVETIGIWLPPGFDYVAGSCNLASDPDTLAYANPYDEDYGSGKVLLWTFGPTFLASFPGAAGYPIERDITFQFSGPENEIPATALSWIDTTDVDGIDYTWDADVKVYKITSTATDDRLGKQTIAEAYTAVAKLRPMGDARSGDYVAVGNTLMEATGDERYRDRLYKESSAIVQSDDPAEPGYIPATAHLDAAYLYWSGWIEEAEGTIWADSCDNMNNWVSGGVWLLDPPTGGRFMGHGGMVVITTPLLGALP